MTAELDAARRGDQAGHRLTRCDVRRAARGVDPDEDERVQGVVVASGSLRRPMDEVGLPGTPNKASAKVIPDDLLQLLERHAEVEVHAQEWSDAAAPTISVELQVRPPWEVGEYTVPDIVEVCALDPVQ